MFLNRRKILFKLDKFTRTAAGDDFVFTEPVADNGFVGGDSSVRKASS